MRTLKSSNSKAVGKTFTKKWYAFYKVRCGFVYFSDIVPRLAERMEAIPSNFPVFLQSERL